MEDHFAQLIRRTAPATERVKKSLLRGLGLITRLVVYAALFACCTYSRLKTYLIGRSAR